MKKLLVILIFLNYFPFAFNQTATVNPGTIGVAQRICYNTAPAPLTELTPPSGGTGTYTYQWQRSTNNSTWTNISGATSKGYNPPVLTRTTYYRRSVKSGSYATVRTSSVRITVNPQITLVQLHNNITINNNTSTNIYVTITGGTSPYTINYSINGVAQAAISNYVSNTNISTGVLTSGVYNYVLTSVTDTYGCAPTSLGTGITVTVNGGTGLTAGSVGSAQSICYNTTPAELTQLTAPSGGDGTYTYQWQSSANNSSWTNISGATSSNYSPPALTASTYYRRIVNSGSFTPANSGSVLITVFSQVTLAQLHDNITISNNTSTNINAAISGGTSPYTINYTLNGTPQTPVANYISGTNISTGVLTAGVYNYVLTSVTDANGCPAASLGTGITVTVDVNSVLTAGSVGTAQSICYNTVPAQLTQLTAPSGGDGTYTFQWQSSANNSSWTNISGATSATYAPPALTTTSYFRRTVSSGSYTPVNSASVQITVYPQITLAQLHDNASITSNTSTNINVAISGGTAPYTINYTRNGTAQTTVTNYTSGTNISTGVLSTGTYNYLLTSVTDANGCTAASLGTGITVTASVPQVPTYVAVDSLFRAQTPQYSGNDRAYELGSEFQTLADGFITKVRLFTHASETGNHTIRLWVLNGSTYSLAAGPFTWNFTAGTHGWRQYPLSTPVAVTANKTYIISITNGTDLNYEKSENFPATASSAYVRYTRGLYGTTLGTAPTQSYASSCYFRDVVFSISGVTSDLTAGSVGTAQSICYNTTPAQLTQLTAPSGGNGTYTYQWQSSANNSTWTNISGATQPTYTPAALTSTTYFRRTVTSGGYSVNSSSVMITVFPQITLAQLHDNISIPTNTSANINVAISGGTSPYTINYTRNGTAQTPLTNYTSGTNISTGVLANGVYNYVLTSVTDARGCTATSLGTGITVTVATQTVSQYIPVDSLFRSQTPQYSGNDRAYELGSEFQTLADGFITKVRLFTHASETGNHTIRLWVLNGSTYSLAAGPFTWNFTAGTHGWRQYPLSTPVAVTANKTYIISITNGTDLNYEKSENFPATASSAYVRYTRGVYGTTLGTAPTQSYASSCYFRDVVFSISGITSDLTAGSVGTAQAICYNTAPAQLTQLTAPSGGDGTYTYQWQSSANNSAWTNISGAVSATYSPSALSATTYYRRTVTSGGFSVNSSSVKITVSPQITLAQLHDNITISSNTSTNINVVVSGGTTPFSVSYAMNGTSLSPVTNYTSGANISTGVLPTGVYNYTLTEVRDTYGCSATNLGTGITVTASENQNTVLNVNKALVLVNSTSAYYSDFASYVSPYLDNFGIPYDLINTGTTSLPDFQDYAVIIFGHRNVYQSGYPIALLESAVSGGTGLYSFDPHLFDYASGFNTLITQISASSSQINISNTTHYITQMHANDTYNSTNNVINLLSGFTAVQRSRLTGAVDLATMSSGGSTASLLQVCSYGNGRVVKWGGYDWISVDILGPIYGMDDLIWRGIVWAARKPFIMQGLPPMITMRVDDVQGYGSNILNNFQWISISNEYGLIPWCGTFNHELPPSYIPTLKNFIDNNHATASPHAFGSNPEFIYFNHYGESPFDPVANTQEAKAFYDNNGLKISKYFVPHYYEVSSSALSGIRAMGGEFLGIHMLPDNLYFGGSPWIHCGPYRLNNDGPASNEYYPVYYGGYVNLNGLVFFNCLTEIRDDGTYEWYPDNNVTTTAARGIRHLRRAINSMVLPSLFTHERYFGDITATNFRDILSQITTSMSGYNPEYTSTDYAVQYIRAKTNIKITNVREMTSQIEITYTGTNDMDTKCYLFNEQSGQITYRLVGLPQISGSNTLNVNK